ncbi:Spartin [Microtus ochrogaster]|uniref:Spartin n=1 Tax=Microtus ochrogaster TaxID=79684 RepID=A0A8J6KQS8_MICOH|nr:Spartin [Microtus ochrogaster]
MVPCLWQRVVFKDFQLRGLGVCAKCIVSNVSAETVQTVKYKYGHSAGEATHKVGDSAINVDLTAYNIDSTGIKAMVKRMVKQTGHTLLEDYRIINSSQKESQGGTSTDVRGSRKAEGGRGQRSKEER